MLLDKNKLYELIECFDVFPGEISSVNKESFEAIYGSSEAIKAKNIIYFMLSKRPIPRLVGESRILYIGKTKTSFNKRYYKYSKIIAEAKSNLLKYENTVEKYGSIEIVYCDFNRFGDNLLQAEGQFLWWYFQNHCEYPPFNYTKTSIRNDVIDESLVNR